MTRPLRAFAIHVVLLACASAGVAAPGDGAGSAPPGDQREDPAEPARVTVPAESFFALVREQDREAARGFYGKYLDVQGMPVVAAAEVADEALERTREIVTRLLAGRPDVVEELVRSGMYLIIIGKDQVYTDMPEYRNHPDPAYQNERVRGTGGRPTSFGEENLLSHPIDRYDDESIAVHEFCHTIDGALRSIDPSWNVRKRAGYARAMEKGLWKDAYAASNPGEFWAELCQSYFDSNRVNNWNHGPIGTREQLRAYDPESYELVRSEFRLKPVQDWRYTPLRTLPCVIPPPERFGVDAHYTKLTWARELLVLGRGASDEALLAANDTVRKMFAYRHDILKALMAAGVKLVVLGRGERLADLPELRAAAQAPGDGKAIDALSRMLDDATGTGLLVVGEENVLGDPRDPLVGDNQVIRCFATALHRVAGKRPVDPDWESRGRRSVQQYELRVKRLDARFDEQLEGLHRSALGSGKWRGTSAANDHGAYWAAGVLAYFDAAGQGPAPEGSPHPVVTREQLANHDPDLWALVHETMAYAGRVDWRHRR